jgi:hypothetical protein
MAFAHRFFSIAASLVFLAALAPPAEAERAVSCQDFRVGLWRAIDEGGNKVARPQLDKASGGLGPTVTYPMTEIAALEGRLICWKGQLFNFSATARLSSDPTETGLSIFRFKDLAAAAICALSSPSPSLQECTSLAETLVRGAMDEYTKARAGKVHGYEVGARLNGESHIEVAADPDGLNFFLYPF